MSNIASLPKWAQAHIEKLEREAREAKAVLDRASEAAGPTPVYCEDHRSGGRRVYSKVADHGQFIIEWEGVRMRVILREGSGEIDVSYEDASRTLGTVNFVPSSTQQFKLRKAIDNAALGRAARALYCASINIAGPVSEVLKKVDDGFYHPGKILRSRQEDLNKAIRLFNAEDR